MFIPHLHFLIIFINFFIDMNPVDFIYSYVLEYLFHVEIACIIIILFFILHIINLFCSHL
jgi:hypothetical protein